MPIASPVPYADALMAELDAIVGDYEQVLERSQIQNIDPNRSASGGGVMFLGFPTHGWGPSDLEHEALRMALLSRVRDWTVRFRLLFPHPTRR